MGLVVSPQNVPLTIYQGATFRQTLIWKYGPSARAATPVNLTEASARAHIRTSARAAEALVRLTSAAEGGLTLCWPARSNGAYGRNRPARGFSAQGATVFFRQCLKNRHGPAP